MNHHRLVRIYRPSQETVCSECRHALRVGLRRPRIVGRSARNLEYKLTTAETTAVPGMESFAQLFEESLSLKEMRAGEVIMADGTNVAVSRRKKQELMDSLAKL